MAEESVAKEEGFTIMGQNMPNITIGYGIFLVIWGISVLIISDSDSPTKYSVIGASIPMLLTGILASKYPEKRKLWMHIAATLGLLFAIGSIMPLAMADYSDLNIMSFSSQLMLVVTGTIYTIICVKSFIWARKQREAASTD